MTLLDMLPLALPVGFFVWWEIRETVREREIARAWDELRERDRLAREAKHQDKAKP